MARTFVGGEHTTYISSSPVSVRLLQAGCQRFKGTVLALYIGNSLTSCPRLRRALSRVNAGPDGTNRVVWTSLREVCRATLLYVLSQTDILQEPVIYVAGRPHVLRLVDRPLENVE